MTYRHYRNEDYEQVKSMCKEHNLAFPADRSLLFVAEHEAKIKGVCGLENWTMIQPFISENPMAAVNLARMIEGVILVNNFHTAWSIVSRGDTKHLSQLQKDGWVIAEDDRIILKKHFE